MKSFEEIKSADVLGADFPEDGDLGVVVPAPTMCFNHPDRVATHIAYASRSAYDICTECYEML